MNLIETLTSGFEHVLPSIGIPKEDIRVEISPDIEKHIYLGNSPFSICVDDESITLYHAQHVPSYNREVQDDVDLTVVIAYTLDVKPEYVVEFAALEIAKDAIRIARDDWGLALDYQKEKELETSQE